MENEVFNLDNQINTTVLDNGSFDEFSDYLQNVAVDLLDYIDNLGTPDTINSYVQKVVKMAYYTATGDDCEDFFEHYIHELDYELTDEEINEYCNFINVKLNEIKFSIDEYLNHNTSIDIYEIEWLNNIISLYKTIED